MYMNDLPTKRITETNDGWSANNQIFYHYGAWGLSPSLRTIYLGTQEELLKKYPTEIKRITRRRKW